MPCPSAISAPALPVTASSKAVEVLRGAVRPQVFVQARSDVGVGRHHDQRLVAVTRGRISHDGLLVELAGRACVSACAAARQDPFGRGVGRARGVAGSIAQSASENTSTPIGAVHPIASRVCTISTTCAAPSPGSSRACMVSSVTSGTRSGSASLSCTAKTRSPGIAAMSSSVVALRAQCHESMMSPPFGRSAIPHDLPRRVHVRERRPGEELEVHEQPVLGRAVAEARERLDRGVEGEWCCPRSRRCSPSDHRSTPRSRRTPRRTRAWRRRPRTARRPAARSRAATT